MSIAWPPPRPAWPPPRLLQNELHTSS